MLQQRRRTRGSKRPQITLSPLTVTACATGASVKTMRHLCALTDIPDGQARAFAHDEQQSLLVVRRGLQAWAYINRCPHAGVPLEWQENRFMSLDGTQLQCSLHGALFNVHDGFCTWGPCRGRSLTPLALSIENGQIHLLD